MVVAACAVLSIPTAVAPGSGVASSTYLSGLAVIVLALWWAAQRWTGVARRGWRFVAAAASCWFVGDLLQRILAAFGHVEDVGPPDLFWLASYPLMVTGVATMIHGRGLGIDVRREVRLDVLVVTVAGALGAWKLMIAPGLDGGTLTMANIVTVLYPLGDVALFATALTLTIAPGRPSVAGRFVVGCLGATLIIDAAFTALPVLAPSFDTGHLDGALLAINALLAAAALHRSAGNLAAAPERNQHGRMHRWRVVLLGGALVTVSVAAVLPGSHATWLDSSMLLLAATATSVTVVARFYGVVKKREAAEERLAHQAHHDHLTGLANRALLLGRLGDALERRAGGDLVLAYLDLDGFKNINDVHGHGGGDAVLFEVGERLRRLVRSGDTVSRLGGDEFVLLCHGVGEDAIEPLGDKLRSVVSAPIVLPSGEVVSVGLSVGIAPVRVPQSPAGLDGVLAEQLLRGADDAMYVAKHRGGGVCIADPIA